MQTTDIVVEPKNRLTSKEFVHFVQAIFGDGSVFKGSLNGQRFEDLCLNKIALSRTAPVLAGCRTQIFILGADGKV